MSVWDSHVRKDGPEKRKEISYKLKSLARLLTEFTKMGRETFNPIKPRGNHDDDETFDIHHHCN